MFVDAGGFDTGCTQAVQRAALIQPRSQSPSTYGILWGILKRDGVGISLNTLVLLKFRCLAVYEDTGIRSLPAAPLIHVFHMYTGGLTLSLTDRPGSVLQIGRGINVLNPVC